MGNISNFNVNKVDMRLSNYDYWDFYLADGDFSIIPQDTIISGDCLVAHYDFNELAIYGGAPYSDVYTPQYGDINGDGQKTLYSLTTWNDATNTGYTLDTIGLTGIDNGLINFDKQSGDTGNTALVSALTGTTLVIASGETRLCLTKVSGMTGNYEYPVEIVLNTGTTVGTYSKLCGGFYQGYYKLDGNSYEVLPNRVPKTWTAEVWLRKPSENDCPTATTITSTTVSAVTCNTFHETSETFVVAGYTLIGTNNFAGTDYQTYQLHVDGTGSTPSNIHTIYGSNDNPLLFPPAWNEGAPFGVDTGGANPAFFGFSSAEWDSWLTVGITAGDGAGELSNIGIDWDPWDGSPSFGTTLSAETGGVFWLNPNNGPALSSSVVVGQITVPSGSTFTVKLNAQGRSVSDEDWYQEDIEFTNGTPSTPQSPLPSGRVCYNDRTDVTLDNTVDISDLLSVLGTFTPSYNIIQDVNLDGVINMEDVQLTLNAFGNSIPLPTSTFNIDVETEVEVPITTLNDNYTGNTGFFLYFGTRAENKFWNIFEGLNTGTTSGCTSGATEWCTIPKETDVSVIDDNGNVIPLSPPPVDLTVTDNKFLFFSRARDTSSSG